MRRSTSDPAIDPMNNGETGGTMGGAVDPMLLQLMAMMNKEKPSDPVAKTEEQKESPDGEQKEDATQTKSRRQMFEESTTKKKDEKPKLLTRSGSDP